MCQNNKIRIRLPQYVVGDALAKAEMKHGTLIKAALC